MRNGPVRVSVFGASGYSGGELTRLLLRHPGVAIDHLFADSSAGRRVDELYPALRGACDLTYETYRKGMVEGSDIALVALPSGHAMELVPELLETGVRVIDLGGDYRLADPALYQRYYRREHASAHLLSSAIYGLPEWNRSSIAGAPLVANPGCYPTASILPLAPLLREGIIAKEGIAIHAMSGISGAGRSASIENSFAELYGNVRAYRVADHQHIPEISTTLDAIGGPVVGLGFIPHLIPIARGIHATATATLTRPTDAAEIGEAFARWYGAAPFVRFIGEASPELRGVVGTNNCDIGFAIDADNRRVILLSVIDNLLKGAAGQALQNLNIMCGFNETEGLT